jgi:hypothetical protein
MRLNAGGCGQIWTKPIGGGSDELRSPDFLPISSRTPSKKCCTKSQEKEDGGRSCSAPASFDEHKLPACPALFRQRLRLFAIPGGLVQFCASTSDATNAHCPPADKGFTRRIFGKRFHRFRVSQRLRIRQRKRLAVSNSLLRTAALAAEVLSLSTARVVNLRSLENADPACPGS